MNISVEASLKKLRTSYIDILYVHWWDYNTSVEEVMNGLHALVTQGKVLYLVSCIFRIYSLLVDVHIALPSWLAGCFGYARLDRVQGESILWLDLCSMSNISPLTSS